MYTNSLAGKNAYKLLFVA